MQADCYGRARSVGEAATLARDREQAANGHALYCAVDERQQHSSSLEGVGLSELRVTTRPRAASRRAQRELSSQQPAAEGPAPKVKTLRTRLVATVA